MTHDTRLVTCPDCDGSRDAADGSPCRACFGQGHYAVDRTPTPLHDWMPPTLPARED